MISVHFQGKLFNITIIQVYAQPLMLKKLKLNGSMKTKLTSRLPGYMNNPEFIYWILMFNMITIGGRSFGSWLDHEDGAFMNEILLFFSCSALSDSLKPQGLQHTRLPCPSPTPTTWAKFSISLSNEYSVLISFKIDWFDLLVVQWTLKCLLQTTAQKHQFFGAQPSLCYNSHFHTWLLEKQ